MVVALQVFWEAVEWVIPDIRKRAEMGTPLTHQQYLRQLTRIQISSLFLESCGPGAGPCREPQTGRGGTDTLYSFAH